MTAALPSAAAPAACRVVLLATLWALSAVPGAVCAVAPAAGPGGGSPRIHDVQGASHSSPLVGQRVHSVTGIVTAVHKSGFVFQAPDADADERPETSEGLLVHLGATPAVAVGDAVAVSGTVLEYRPDGRAEQLTVTELGESPEVVVLARGQPLPAPVILGRAGRVPPACIFSDDAHGGDLDLGGPFDPEADGLDWFESLEGMRVAVQDAVAIGPTSARNEVWVLGDDGALATGRNARGGLTASASDGNPERLLLDSSQSRLPRVDAGARFPGSLVGVLGYAFGNYRIAVQSCPAPVGGVSPDRDEPPAREGEVLVASFNLLNFSARTEASRVAALARQIVTGLGAPDLLALQEVQDDSGPADDGTTSARRTLSRLVDAITAAGGPAYRSVDIAPLDGQDGGQPGANIRSVLLYRSDRGLALVVRGESDKDGGESAESGAGAAGGDGARDAEHAPGTTGSRFATDVERHAGGARLARSPGLVAPLDPAFARSRKPLAVEFTLAGRPLFVVANHWNSKSGDQPLAGRYQPPVRGSEVQRASMARAVRAFADELLAADADADLIVLGDFNDAPDSAALAVLTSASPGRAGQPGRAGLIDLAGALSPTERFSYLYEGNGQQFDHILLSSHLLRASIAGNAGDAPTAGGPATALPAFRIVHLNAEFQAQPSDHDPCVARLRLSSPR